MSPTPRPTEPQLSPEGLRERDQAVPRPDEASISDPVGEQGSEEARPFGNLTENLTTRWNVESR